MTVPTPPAYQVIYAAILKKINKGKFKKDEPIPSENELALKYGVSRMTARKSVDLLVQEGYLMRQKGRGTFITGRRNLAKPELSLSARVMAEDGRIYDEVLGYSELWQVPGFTPDEGPFWMLQRLRYYNDVAAILEKVYFPKSLVPDFSEELAKGSMVSLMEATGDLGSLKLTAEPHTFDKKKDAKILGLTKGDSLLLVKGELEYLDGRICLTSESLQNHRVLPLDHRLLR